MMTSSRADYLPHQTIRNYHNGSSSGTVRHDVYQLTPNNGWESDYSEITHLTSRSPVTDSEKMSRRYLNGVGGGGGGRGGGGGGGGVGAGVGVEGGDNWLNKPLSHTYIGKSVFCFFLI